MEVILKDIYIIKNKINDKVYIGQSINAQRRFISHLSRAKINSDHSPIHDAINKLGKENFYLEILEKQISNYDEREKYWIKYYNSIVPNGYNLLEGGEHPPYHKGEDCYNASTTQEIIDKVIYDLINTNKKITEIANEYNLSRNVVSSVLYGYSWRNDDYNYPLRETDDREIILDKNSLEEIIYLLKHSSCSMEQIGKYYNTDRKAIARINNGQTHFSEKLTYPIRVKRKRSKQTVEDALKRRKINERL